MSRRPPASPGRGAAERETRFEPVTFCFRVPTSYAIEHGRGVARPTRVVPAISSSRLRAISMTPLDLSRSHLALLVRLGPLRLRQPRRQDPHELRRRLRPHIGPGVRQVVLHGRVRQAEPVGGFRRRWARSCRERQEGFGPQVHLDEAPTDELVSAGPRPLAPTKLIDRTPQPHRAR